MPFVPGEACWELAGLEMSPERAALEAEPVRPKDGGWKVRGRGPG